jgi:hypothetical protein
MTAALRILLLLAGAGQLALAAASLAIPRVLRWREDTARLRSLTRQVFWTYAAYIWGTNVAMGLLSVVAPEALLGGSTLARAICGYIAVYWTARLLVQFFYFDRTQAPPGLAPRLAEVALVGLFLYLGALYGYLALVGA